MHRHSPKPILGLLYGFIATVLFSSFYILIRVLFGNYNVDPVVFTFLRFASAGIFFLVIIGLKGDLPRLGQAMRRDAPMMILLAMTGIVGDGLLLQWALKYTTASRSSLFANASPIFTVLFAWLIYHESFGRFKSIGMLVGFAGIALAIASQNAGDMFMPSASVLGDLLAVASGVLWALYTVFNQKIILRHSVLVAGTGPILIGSAILLGLAATREFPWPLFVDPWFLALVLYSGVGVCGVAFLLWIAALKHISAGKLGAFGYISTMLTMVGSFMLLHERITWVFVAGAALVIISIYIVLRRPSSPKLPAAQP